MRSSSSRLLGRTLAACAVLLVMGPGRARSQTPGPTIDTIVVVNLNVFDQADMLGPVTRIANAIHVKTHASVIRRTLLFNQGDPFDSARAVESGRALRGLNVFRQVVIDTMRIKEKLALRVVTADGWSTKPQLNFSSSGGSVTWAGGIEEENLLGTATSLTALYTKTPDRNTSSFLYTNPHFLGRRPRLFGLYQDLSDGSRGQWALGVPFYETAARRAFGTGGEAGTQRVLRFRDGLLADSTERHGLRFGFGGGVALHATSHGYFRLWVNGNWRREDFVPESLTVIPRSVFGAVGAGIEWAHARYQVLQGFNTYVRREDINLSQTFRVGLWAAPQAWGYPSGQAGVGGEVSGQVSTVWPGGFIVMRGGANGVYNGTALDSARARGGITIASQNLMWQTIILHVEGGVLRRPKFGGEFDTWADQTGPRLFGAHAFTGTHTVWVAFEDRFVVADDFFGLVGVGLAPFIDWGGAWFDDETPRTGSDMGIAIRLGPTRAVRGDVEEFAIGMRFGQGFSGGRWAISIRRGISF